MSRTIKKVDKEQKERPLHSINCTCGAPMHFFGVDGNNGKKYYCQRCYRQSIIKELDNIVMETRRLELGDKFQFGPHVMQVLAVYSETPNDPERLITAQCIPTCCSIERAVTIVMPANELISLSNKYSSSFPKADL